MKRLQVAVAGTDVTCYEVQGEGAGCALFVHGVGGSGKMWALQMKSLRSYGRMVGIDLPGLSDGELPERVRSLSDYAPLCGEVLTALGIEEAVWIGNSLGGRVALEAALTQPSQVAGLGLIGSAGIRAESVQVAAIDRLSPEEFERLVYHRPERFAFLQIKGRDQTGSAKAREMYGQLAANTELMDFSDQLGEITVPTRVIWGRHDGVIPLELGQRLVAGIPGAKLTVLDQSAHVPQLEQHQDVNLELAALLASVYGEA